MVLTNEFALQNLGLFLSSLSALVWTNS